ncbi:MAG: hypothetical protein IVW51_18790 [Thermaceae bacterium]|nr:hypothetical protein [Thermaceae bacterium]
MKYLGLVLLVLLSACTGSQTDTITAVLAVAANVSTATGSVGLIRFYDTSRLQPGSGASSSGCQKTSQQDSVCQLVWTWTLDQPIVALFYQRSTQATQPDQLWVLTPSQLRRYATTGFTTNPASAPPLPTNTVTTPDLNTDCNQGYLRQGSSKLLLVCPTTNPNQPLALPSAWIIDLNNPSLDPTANPALNLSSLSSVVAPLRLTLDNQDRLIYLGPQQIGIGQDLTDTTKFRSLVGLANRPTTTTEVPSDLAVVVDNKTNLATAYGLFADPTSGDLATYLLTWDLSSTPTFIPAPTPDVSLSANFFAAGGLPLVVLGRPVCNPACSTTNGKALARFDGAFKLPPITVLDRSSQYSAAVLGLDQYLYAAQYIPGVGGSTLRVLDFFGPTESLTPIGLASLTLDPVANATTVALAYVPVAQ